MAVALAGVGAARSANAELRYSATLLRPLMTGANAYSDAISLNDVGVVVGSEVDMSLPASVANQRALSWNAAGVPTAPPVPPGSFTSIATLINNDGTRIVEGRDRDLISTGIYRSLADGSLVATGLARVTDINDAGVVVGTAGTTGATPALSFPQGTIQLLNKGAIESFHSLRVGQNGQVVGSVSQSTNPMYQAFRLSAATAPTPVFSTGPTNSNGGAITGIARNSDLVGYTHVAGSGFPVRTPVVIRGSSMTPLAIPSDHASGMATAMNDRDTVIGTSAVNSAAPSSGYRLLLWSDTTSAPIDLRTRVTGLNPALKSLLPLDINNRGQVLVSGSLDHDGRPLTPDVLASYRLDPIRHPGDATTDGVTNFDDLLLLAAHYNRSGNGSVFYETGDFNYDWRVDFDDLLILAANYNTSAAPAALARIAIPEPATLLGASLLACTLIRPPRRS